MKEPRRLLSQGATDFERQLLRAVVNERPSALLRSRMQRGLGLVGPLAWASTVKAMLGSVAGKVTGLVALGVLAAAGVTALQLVPGSSSGESAPPAATSITAPAPAASPESAPPESPPPVGEPALAPAAPAGSVAPAEASGSASPAAPTASPAPEVAADAVAAPDATLDDDRQLREEIALLDGARGALERGDREAARGSLRTYRERFPSGVLSREANVLRRRAEPTRGRPHSGR